jgi:histidine triad (HIT) family protein
MAAMCQFCEIASGAVRAHVVFENAGTLAFLDHRPLFPGHSLLIPKRHFETLGDLPVEDVAPLFSAAQFLALAVENAMEAQGTFVAINNKVSQSVPHLHVHIVPRRRKDGLRGFFWPRTKYRDDAHMAETARLVQEVVGEMSARGEPG